MANAVDTVEPGSLRDWGGYACYIIWSSVQAAALPPITMLGTTLSLYAEFFPVSYCDDAGYDNPVTLLINKDNLSGVLRQLAPHYCIFPPSTSEEAQKRVRESWESFSREKYTQMLDLAKTRCPRAHLALQVRPSQGTWAPATAVGSRFSFEEPVIVVAPVPLSISAVPKASAFFKKARENFSNYRGLWEFVLCHEYAHMEHGDGIVHNLSSLGVDVVATAMYVAVIVSSPLSWMGAILHATLYAFAMQVIGKICLTRLRLWQESRADREAVTILGTSQGAKELFQDLPQQARGYEHPPISQRLEDMARVLREIRHSDSR